MTTRISGNDSPFSSRTNWINPVQTCKDLPLGGTQTEMDNRDYKVIRGVLRNDEKSRAVFKGRAFSCLQLPTHPEEGDVWNVRFCNRMFIWNKGSWGRLDTISHNIYKGQLCPVDCDAKSLVARLAWGREGLS